MALSPILGIGSSSDLFPLGTTFHGKPNGKLHQECLMGRYLMIKSWSNYRVARFSRWIRWFRTPCCSRLFKVSFVRKRNNRLSCCNVLLACRGYLSSFDAIALIVDWKPVCETGRNILVATTRLVSSWNIISDRLIRWLNRGIWQIWILSFPSDFNTFDIFLKMVMFGYYSIINASIRYKMYMYLFILYILIFKVLVTYRSTNIFIILTFK